VPTNWQQGAGVEVYRWRTGGAWGIMLQKLALLVPPMVLPRPAGAQDWCGPGTSAAWGSRCAGAVGSGKVHIAGCARPLQQ
jgi:hypothetical protein